MTMQPAAVVDRPGPRLLAALLAVSERRQLSALVGISEPPLAVVVLPELGAGVAIIERGEDAPEGLRQRVDALLAGHANGVLHLVLAAADDGAAASDRAVLVAADREAHDPNRLGVHLLDTKGRIHRVAGRRMGLLGEAAALIPETPPLAPAAIAAHNGQAQKRREEAATFAAALDHRSQRATRVLGAINIVMFALTAIWSDGGHLRALMNMGANSAIRVEDGQLWRLLSYAFLHGDAIHLVVNLIALFSFGGFLEGLLGWRRIVLLYGVCGLAGGLASALIGDTPASVGASGAIWGLMAAGIGIVLRRESILPPLIVSRLRPRLLGVLALNVAISVLPYFVRDFPRIDLWAHLGGGLAGFLLAAPGLLTRGLVPGQAPQGPTANPLWLRIASGLFLALMTASVATAFATGKPWHRQVISQPDQLA